MSWSTELKRKFRDYDAVKDAERFLLGVMPEFEQPRDIRSWEKRAAQLRRDALAKVFLRGYSPAIVSAKPRVAWGEVLRPDPSYRVRKLRYEIYPNYWIPALLYEPVTKAAAKMPLMLNPNGHHAGGKAATYKQARCVNLARRGVLALSIEFIGMSELDADLFHNQQAHLNVTGLAGVGLFYLALKKALDFMLADKRVDHTRVGVTGLSGGGWQTIVLAALDTRITLAVPVAGYTAVRSRIGCDPDMGDLEQNPPDMVSVLDYQEMTAMLAPRPALLINNEFDDCCFRSATAKPVIYDPIVPVYEMYGAADRFEFYSNKVPGTHNYDSDNRSRLYRFLNKHWHLHSPNDDIHGEHDILTEPELSAGLPIEQETMLSIALSRAKRLARKRRPAATASQRKATRKAVAKVIRLPVYGTPSGANPKTGVSSELLRVGPLTVPVTWRCVPRAKSALLILDDGGREARANTPPPADTTVMVADVWQCGAAKSKTWFSLAAECAGQRPLGIQVAQILALTKRLSLVAGVKRIDVLAEGRAVAFSALIAAGLEPERYRKLTASWETMSLVRLMQWPLQCDEAYSLFSFGLLEAVDTPDLVALLEGVEYHLYGRSTKPISNGRA